MATKNRTQWDASRFLKTLNYFGEIPFLGSFRWAQQLLGKNTTAPGVTLSVMKRRVIILGNCSSKLLTFLQENLSPSVDLLLHASSHEKDDSDISDVHAGITSSELKKLVRSVDTTVAVSNADSEALIVAISQLYQDQSGAVEPAIKDFVEQSVFDFSMTNHDLLMWGALDDVVMGGVSQGSFFVRAAQADQKGDRQAVFAGNVSTDNSGGFSSVRTKNFEPPFNLSGWQGMRLRVKGDGQRYKFIARNSDGWDSPAYIYGFDTVAGEWIVVDIPFDEMVATFRARSMPEAPAFDPQKVFSLQLMLSKFEYDRQLNPNFKPGPFELAVRQISVYRPRQGPPLVIVGDRTQQSSAQIDADPNQISYQFIDSALDDAALAKAIAQAVNP